MKPLILAAAGVFLVLTAASAASDLTITLSPSTEYYPPGTDAGTCVADASDNPPCILFFGTLTDNDTDDSTMYLTYGGVTFTDPADDSYFTDDEQALYIDAPTLALSGDPNAATDGNPIPNTESTAIFGLLPDAPPNGVYTGMVTIDYSIYDTNGNPIGSSDQTADFTIVVTPEPASIVFILFGFLVMAFLPRIRRRAPC